MLKKIYKQLPSSFKELKSLKLNIQILEDESILVRVKNWII